MARRLRIGALALMLSWAAASCSTAPDPGIDSPLIGTWEQKGPQAVAVLSIAHDGETFRIRPGKEVFDGSMKVTCDWDGTCDEFNYGILKLQYRSTVWTEEESGNLMWRWEGQSVNSDVSVDFVYELEVEGDELICYRRKVGDRPDASLKRYRRVSDEVRSPPRRG